MVATDWLQVAGIVLTPVASAVIGALAGMLREANRRARSHDERQEAEHRALMEGVKEIMRWQLQEMHRVYVVEGHPMPYDEKPRAESIYRVYHALGGNGTGTHLFSELMEAKVGDAAQGREEGDRK